jgi:hypothetical protein
MTTKPGMKPTGDGGKADMTRDEMKNIEGAMKDPAFRDMLGDYMLEVSDPANKSEADAYLRQMERDRELPKGLILIQPDASFCITSHIASEKERKFEQKMYVNICMHPTVDKPQFHTVTQPNGTQGRNWRLPHQMSKVRYNQDKDKNGDAVVVNVIDVCFHPEAMMFAAKHPQYHKVVCETALGKYILPSMVKKFRWV